MIKCSKYYSYLQDSKLEIRNYLDFIKLKAKTLLEYTFFKIIVSLILITRLNKNLTYYLSYKNLA